MYKIYQIEYGDTIDVIARKAGTTSDVIRKLNGIDNDSELFVGNLIVVPKENEQIFETYRVKAGDSIYSISRMYDVDPDMLLMLNGLNKNDYIYPNQEIMVPLKGVSIYVTQPGDTLDKVLNNFNVDYILSHSPSASVLGLLKAEDLYEQDVLTRYLQDVENKIDFTESRNVIIAALILVLSIGIAYSAAGAISFKVGTATIRLTGLAVGVIAGIIFNTILPKARN